jgi:hypothetical protein
MCWLVMLSLIPLTLYLYRQTLVNKASLQPQKKAKRSIIIPSWKEEKKTVESSTDRDLPTTPTTRRDLVWTYCGTSRCSHSACGPYDPVCTFHQSATCSSKGECRARGQSVVKNVCIVVLSLSQNVSLRFEKIAHSTNLFGVLIVQNTEIKQNLFCSWQRFFV